MMSSFHRYFTIKEIKKLFVISFRHLRYQSKIVQVHKRSESQRIRISLNHFERKNQPEKRGCRKTMNLMMRKITIMTIQPPTTILALLVGSNFNALSYVLYSNKDFYNFPSYSNLNQPRRLEDDYCTKNTLRLVKK